MRCVPHSQFRAPLSPEAKARSSRQIGTILPTDSPFGGARGDNLPRSSRKRTLVDELVDDAEAKSYAKKKFKELQSVRGAKGRGTLAAKKALRKPKW